MIKGTTMSRANSVKHGIALMREFHSEDGLSNTTNIMLESLSDTRRCASGICSHCNPGRIERKDFEIWRN